ncbi:26377_t:CDS:2, partial [Gigaspora margarita]
VLVVGQFMPQQRFLQTSVLDNDRVRWYILGGNYDTQTQNGTIIIFGGQSSTNYIQAPPDLVMLDTNVYPMKWRALNVSSTNAPPSLTCHSATLFDNFMIIAFGKITVASGGSGKLNSQIYVFDILNNEWVTSTNRTSNSTNLNNKSTNIISNSQIPVVIILFIVIGLIIFFTIVGALIYRKYRNYIMEEKLTESFHDLLAT